MPAFPFEAVAQLVTRQAPPPAREPNPAYDNENNAPTLFAVNGTFYALAMVIVMLRMYVRAKVIKTVGPDDYVMCAAALFATGYMICNSLQSKHGWGRHIHTIKAHDMKVYRHIGFFKSQLFVLGTNSVKISIALLLMRLATLSKYKKFLWGTIIFMICFTIACLGTLIFNCSPISGAWDPVVKAKGRCYSMTVFKNIGLFNTVINVTTDIMFATIPIPLIWKLQISKKTRISLAAILSLGFFACAAGIVKGVKQTNFLKIKDNTFWEEINTWGFIQLLVGIIAACIPTLKPLFRAVIDYTKAVTSQNGTNGRTTGRNNLSYDKPNKKGKPTRSSIRLDTMQTYSEFEDHEKAGHHHRKGDIEGGKYPREGNDSSNFDHSDPPSPDTSVENILPNAISDWSDNSKFGITRTTEVTVQSTVNLGPSLVGQPQAGVQKNANN